MSKPAEKIYKALAAAGIAEEPAGRIAEAVVIAVRDETAKRSVTTVGATNTDADFAELQKQVTDARFETKDEFAKVREEIWSRFAATQKQITDARLESRDKSDETQKETRDNFAEVQTQFAKTQEDIAKSQAKTQEDIAKPQDDIQKARMVSRDDINKAAKTMRNWILAFAAVAIAVSIASEYL